MVIKVSNKNIHRYKYKKKRIWSKRKCPKQEGSSFGDIVSEIEFLKAKGLISISSVDISIAKVIKKLH